MLLFAYMSISLFPAIFDHPQKIRFSEQEENEHIEIFVRQHWVTNLGWVIFAAVLAFLPFFLPAVGRLINSSAFFDIPLNLSWAMLVLWYLLVAAYILENYLFWYFNIYIVTDRHLVDIALQSLLARNITEVRLEDIESARTRIAGIGRSLFNYGDVIIETAAEKQNIEFLAIPHPDLVADRIQDLQESKKGSSDAD